MSISTKTIYYVDHLREKPESVLHKKNVTYKRDIGGVDTTVWGSVKNRHITKRTTEVFVDP